MAYPQSPRPNDPRGGSRPIAGARMKSVSTDDPSTSHRLIVDDSALRMNGPDARLPEHADAGTRGVHSARAACKRVRRMPRPTSLFGKCVFRLQAVIQKTYPGETEAQVQSQSPRPARARLKPRRASESSPQALSIGLCARSATITSRPCRRAARAVASPAGPPPITSTSVSGGSIGYHRTSNISEQKPDPIANSRPWLPGSGRAVLGKHLQAPEELRPRTGCRNAGGSPTIQPNRPGAIAASRENCRCMLWIGKRVVRSPT